MPLSQTILVLGARGFGPRSWLAGTRLGAGGLRFSMLGTRLRSWGARGVAGTRLRSWGPAVGGTALELGARGVWSCGSAEFGWVARGSGAGLYGVSFFAQAHKGARLHSLLSFCRSIIWHSMLRSLACSNFLLSHCAANGITHIESMTWTAHRPVELPARKACWVMHTLDWTGLWNVCCC